jgi:hypothetical protein
MTAPSSGRDDATLRGAVVLIVAIVIGLALLARGGGGGEEADATDGTTESTASTTTVAGGDSTTVSVPDSTTTLPPTGETRPPAEILVAVLNATETAGWARENATTLESAQYQVDPGNVPEANNTDTSIIYATPDAQADAQAIASLLGLGSAPVEVKPAEPLGENGEDANADVVVVLGSDSVG